MIKKRDVLIGIILALAILFGPSLLVITYSIVSSKIESQRWYEITGSTITYHTGQYDGYDEVTPWIQKIVDLDSFQTYKDKYYNLFARNKDFVFCGVSILDDVDPTTFVPLKNTYYTYDQDSVHYIYPYGIFSTGCTNTKLEDVDIKTFQVINGFYAKDKNHVYYKGIALPNSVPETFEVIDIIYINENTKRHASSAYSKDKDHVYINNIVIEDADPSTFKLIKNGELRYWRDDNHIFCNNKVLESVDPETYEVLDDRLSKDKDHVFRNCKIIEYINPNWEIYESKESGISFKYPDKFFLLDRSKDDNRIYISPKEMDFNDYGNGYYELIEISFKDKNEDNEIIQALRYKNLSEISIGGKNAVIISGTIPENLPHYEYDVFAIFFPDEEISIIATDRFNQNKDIELEAVVRTIATTLAIR